MIQVIVNWMNVTMRGSHQILQLQVSLRMEGWSSAGRQWVFQRGKNLNMGLTDLQEKSPSASPAICCKVQGLEFMTVFLRIFGSQKWDSCVCHKERLRRSVDDCHDCSLGISNLGWVSVWLNRTGVFWTLFCPVSSESCFADLHQNDFLYLE